MRFRTTNAFDRDLAGLPREHRRLFVEAVRTQLLPAIAAGAFEGRTPWPGRLRVHRLTGHSTIFSMTWSFSGPDGRATFSVETDAEGSVLVWRRIGRRAIYREL